MSYFNQTYLGNTLESWLVALGVATLSCLLLSLLQRILLRRLSTLATKTKTDLDDLVVDVLRRTRAFFLLAISGYVGTYALTLSTRAMQLVQTVLILALLIQSALWGSAAISFWLSRTTRRRVEEDAASATTLTALGFVSKLVLWSILLLLALDNVGVNVTGLVAGLGIGGIAIALAVQNILGDLFASLSIVLDKPFVIGDFIIVDQVLGTVERIGLKTTRIRSLSGEEIVFSNTDLLRSRVRNYKRMFERRVVFTLGVTYQTPFEKLPRISSLLRDIIQLLPDVRFDRAHFKAYGDFALIYEAVYYVTSPDYNRYMDIQEAINFEIYRRFQQEGIEFAYPTQTLFVQGLDPHQRPVHVHQADGRITT